MLRFIQSRTKLTFGGVAPVYRVVSTANVRPKLFAGLLCACACFAQPWELGGTIGYGVYRDVRIDSPGGEATAGVRNRFTAGAVIGENLFEHFSGEIGYLYHDGDPFISASGKRGNIQGQSHTFHYDLLFHPRNREQKVRPYLAAGVGGKYYRTTGPAPNPPPLPQIASLVQLNQWTWLVDFGAGIKYRVAKNVVLRGDFRDFITPFPTKLFVPVAGGTDRGIFHQFTPTVGLSFGF